MHSRNLRGTLLFQAILAVTINLSLGSKIVPCTPTGFCKCEFPNGMGVDLISLKGKSFNITVKQDEILHFYPCNNTIIASNTTLNECAGGASLCLEKHIGNETQFFNLGFLNESHFNWDNINNNPEINFRHVNRSTKITLECGYSKPSSLELVSDLNENQFDLKFTSEYACVGTVTNEGHSVFSTFFLIVLILFLFYFVCGFLVLRFIRGARGWEAIPNGEFWKSSFNSLKRTCTYCGRRNQDAYDTI